jgi:hypothetical protein
MARRGVSGGHHAELAVLHEAAEVVHLSVQGAVGVEVRLLVRIGGLAACVGIGELLLARHFEVGRCIVS